LNSSSYPPFENLILIQQNICVLYITVKVLLNCCKKYCNPEAGSISERYLFHLLSKISNKSNWFPENPQQPAKIQTANMAMSGDLENYDELIGKPNRYFIE